MISPKAFDVVSFVICLLSGQSAYPQFALHEILVNGQTDQRINIVFLAEGYTESELPDFAADADAAVSYLLNIEPWNSYSTYFNAYRIDVISNESGSDHPGTALDEPGIDPIIFVDTYFNSSYDSYGIHRLLTIPPNSFDPNPANGYDKAYSLLSTLFPEYDIVFIIVNSVIYGGSGGTFPIFSTNSYAVEIAAHEVGHSFAFLDDEYDTGNTGFNDPDIWPNTTKVTIRELIKWHLWIDASTPIPTPENPGLYGQVIGLFEGAHYNPTVWYRPKYDCRMNHPDVPFCAVCSEALVKEFYTLLDPILSFAPLATSLTLSEDQAITFSVETLIPTVDDLDVAWQLDGNTISGETETFFQLNGSDVETGLHTLIVVVQDTTGFVRNDPANLLQSTQSWSVEKLPGGQAVFAVDRAAIDFGQIALNVTALDSFTVYNHGNIALAIFNITSNISGLNITPTQAEIPPEDSIKIVLEFTPDSVQMYSGHVVLVHSAPTSPDSINIAADVITSVSVTDENLPKTYALFQNYPNPFNPETRIRYQIPASAHVTLKIYNLRGQEVDRPVDAKQPVGKYEITWRPANLSSGVYVCRLQVGDFRESRKLVLLR